IPELPPRRDGHLPARAAERSTVLPFSRVYRPCPSLGTRCKGCLLLELRMSLPTAPRVLEAAPRGTRVAPERGRTVTACRAIRRTFEVAQARARTAVCPVLPSTVPSEHPLRLRKLAAQRTRRGGSFRCQGDRARARAGRTLLGPRPRQSAVPRVPSGVRR